MCTPGPLLRLSGLAALLLAAAPHTAGAGEKPAPYVLIKLRPPAFARALGLLGREKIQRVRTDGDGRAVAMLRRNLLAELERQGIPWSDQTRRVPFKYSLPNFDRRRFGPLPERKGLLCTDDGYHDHLMVERLLREFARRYPRITDLRRLGESRQGRPIWALKISDNARLEEDEPALLFNGSHHGSELLSTEFVLDTIEYLLHHYGSPGRARRWIESYEIWCVPLVNPDGNHRFLHVAGTGRKNGRDTIANGRIDRGDGVDLNRNYPFRWHSLAGIEPPKGKKKRRAPSSGDPAHGNYRGPTPASEPETRAMMALAEQEHFLASISYHTAATKILVPYTIDNLRNPEPNVAWLIGCRMAELADSCRPDRKYKAVRNLYSVDGVDQDWLYHEYGTLAFLIEGPRTNPPYRRDRNRMAQGLRPAWFHLLDVLLDGPAVSGHLVAEDTGEPLAGLVTVREIRTFSGEKHPTHPATGRFDQVLPAPGTYHLRFASPGYRPGEVEIRVGAERRFIRVALSRKGEPGAGAGKKGKRASRPAGEPARGGRSPQASSSPP